jgi:CHRD domain
MLRLSNCFAGLIGCFMAALAAPVEAQTIELRAFLSPAFETPALVTTGQGKASAQFNVATNVLTVSATNTGFAGTVAHVHRGAQGVAGPVVFGLSPGPNTWSGSATLSAADVDNLLNEGLYVNIHSAANPGGQVRGQLIPAVNLISLAEGSKEVPPNNSTNFARGRFIFDQATDRIDYEVDVVGFTAVAAHIHVGAQGVNGGIVFGLTQTGPQTFKGTTAPLTTAQKALMWSKGYYLNVHSAAFPGGEVRDQLHRGMLNSDGRSFPVGLGGTLTLEVDGYASTAGHLFLVLGSLSGSTPGLPFAGQVLPLNFDAYLNFTLLTPNTPPLGNSFGFLSATAEADTTFTLTAGAFPALVGLTVNHAALTIDPANTANISLGCAVPNIMVP